MSFDEVFIGFLGFFVLVLVYNIVITVLNSLNVKNLNEDKILSLQIQFLSQQEKSFKLIERERLLNDLNASLNQRVFIIFKKIISLQKLIFEAYH